MNVNECCQRCVVGAVATRNQRWRRRHVSSSNRSDRDRAAAARRGRRQQLNYDPPLNNSYARARDRHGARSKAIIRIWTHVSCDEICKRHSRIRPSNNGPRLVLGCHGRLVGQPVACPPLWLLERRLRSHNLPAAPTQWTRRTAAALPVGVRHRVNLLPSVPTGRRKHPVNFDYVITPTLVSDAQVGSVRIGARVKSSLAGGGGSGWRGTDR